MLKEAAVPFTGKAFCDQNPTKSLGCLLASDDRVLLWWKPFMSKHLASRPPRAAVDVVNHVKAFQPNLRKIWLRTCHTCKNCRADIQINWLINFLMQMKGYVPANPPYIEPYSKHT